MNVFILEYMLHWDRGGLFECNQLQQIHIEHIYVVLSDSTKRGGLLAGQSCILFLPVADGFKLHVSLLCNAMISEVSG